MSGIRKAQVMIRTAELIAQCVPRSKLHRELWRLWYALAQYVIDGCECRKDHGEDDKK